MGLRATARLGLGLAGLILSFMPVAAAGRVPSFYDPPAAKIPGPPGSIVAEQGINAALTTARAYRILYRSVLDDGKPTAVSGFIVVPNGAPPAGGFPVVAWAHGTTGVVRDCAPSIAADPVTSVPGIARLVAGRNVVVATDFVGLGAGGTHPYLVGESAGRAVLDSVRAARHFGGGARYAVWGYSQGGHAALFAGQMAQTYAPDLTLIGVAVAAPATKLALHFENDLGSFAGRVLTSMALKSWSQVFGHPLGMLMKPDAARHVAHIAGDCVNIIGDDLKLLGENRELPKVFLDANPATTRPWSVTMVANTPTRAPKAPVFIAQGTADQIIAPAITEAFVKQLCRQGARVDFVKVDRATHGNIANRAAARAVAWIADRFAGKPAPSTC